MPKLTSYHFTFGNSTTGAVGFCGRVNARSRAEAVEILRRRLPETLNVFTATHTDEYINVYFNLKRIRASDIDESQLLASRNAAIGNRRKMA